MIDPERIVINDYTYNLPNERIATHPPDRRDASKLLVYKCGKITDDRFFNLAEHIPAGSLLVLNNTKVIRARIHFQKQSGGFIEIFCLEPYEQSMETALQQQSSSRWTCMIGGASKWKPGQVLQKELTVEGKPVELQANFEGKTADAFVIRFTWNSPDVYFMHVLQAAGAIPLPPYIKRTVNAIDADRYQTIFGNHEGSVAAPTAALHFSEEVFTQLRERGINTEFVTLNVGAGTFKPVKTASIAGHQMHGEWFTVRKEALEKFIGAEMIVAIGTTSLRTLESLYWLGVKLINGQLKESWSLGQWEAYHLPGEIPYKKVFEAVLDWMNERNLAQLQCRTSLLIAPGYLFKTPAGLVTNFHQPDSTLLLLIAAFIGKDWRKVYQHALDNDYRFLSYGDSSYLVP